MSKELQELQLDELTPKNDFIFRYLFGKKRNEALLKDLLEAILEKKISKVELDKDAQLLPDDREKKIGILDVKAVLDDGTIVNIEMQNYNTGNMIKRMSYYLSRLYAEQLGKGEEYEKLNKTISIGILNFNYFKDIKDFHTKWKFSGRDIFVSASGKKSFELCEDRIKLYDFNDDYYEIDLNGNEI